jgi:hypothetical protein
MTVYGESERMENCTVAVCFDVGYCSNICVLNYVIKYYVVKAYGDMEVAYSSPVFVLGTR